MRWEGLSLVEQMANIGSEVSRTIIWKTKNKEYSRLAFERALELLALTITDPKNKHGLKELCRAREMLVDWFLGNPEYASTDKEWNKYYMEFTLAANLRK